MIIEIDNTLESITDDYRYKRDINTIIRKTYGLAPRKDIWDYAKSNAGEKNITASMPEVAHAFHTSYVDYLAQAYAMHKKIVLTPDIIWYTIMCEIAAVVVANPKAYGTLFTTDPDKKTDIIVMTNDPTHLPMDKIIQQLRAFVPTDIDLFLPEFTTTDPMARLARYAAFAETCSPYYSYSTMMCGFPAINIQGRGEDYATIMEKVEQLAGVFRGIGDKILSEYLSIKVYGIMTSLLLAISRQDTDFFAKILTTQRCGSGGEIELNGWWVRSMYVKDHTRTKPENMPSHISRVQYKNLETDRNFTLNCGLFYSDLVDGFDVPRWGAVVNEIVTATVETAVP